MKTLDEVITGMTELILSGKTADVKSTVRDAFHYLKEYRTEQKILSDRKEHYEYWEHKYYAELEKNDPLTWDELKTMEGKPVWVEGKTVKHWAVITGIYYDDLNEGYLLETYYSEKQGSNTSRRKRSTLGNTWQAYRKEQE